MLCRPSLNSQLCLQSTAGACQRSRHPHCCVMCAAVPIILTAVQITTACIKYHASAVCWTWDTEGSRNARELVQEARTMVASFPFFLDPPAICNTIAAECTGAPLIAQEQAALISGAPWPAHCR